MIGSKIKIYEFPGGMKGKGGDSLNKKMPFGVVGSNVVLEEAGNRVRGRKYPWGTVNIEDKVRIIFSNSSFDDNKY